MIYTGQVLAVPVQIEHDGLRLNGNLVVPAGSTSGPMFILVHGTWGHSGMEIIDGLQARLTDAGQKSLAITLSLGVDNRQGFMNCEPPIKANHGAAADEINQWVKYAQTRWQQIVLVGHSRGGNQVMLYNQAYNQQHILDYSQTHSRNHSQSDSTLGNQSLTEPNVARFVLIAPMTWDADEAAKAYAERFGAVLADRLAVARARTDEVIRADLLNCPDIDVLGRSFLSYYSAEPTRNTPELLATAAQPVLIFQGTDDSLAQGFIAQEALVEKNPLITVQWLDGADHFFRDLYTDDIVDAMLEWLP